jgi:hypothetical protein
MWTPVAAGVEQIVAILQLAENPSREAQDEVLKVSINQVSIVSHF